jgi:hypothetical protein
MVDKLKYNFRFVSLHIIYVILLVVWNYPSKLKNNYAKNNWVLVDLC